MSEHLLSIQNLSVAFRTKQGEISAISDVNLFVNDNEILAVVGESGCGKSVTIQTVMRLLPTPPMLIKDGKIIYNGIDIISLSEKEMVKYRGNDFAMIFQHSLTGLNPTMSIENQLCEGIMFHQKVSKADARKLSLELLSQVKLDNVESILPRYPHTLSGGQHQRIMIAMAIACKPKILFADEPTTSLDVTLQNHILDILKELRDKSDISIVLVAHDLRIVSKIADRVAIMYAGSVIETGKVEQIFNNPSHPYTWGLLCSLPDNQCIHKSELYSINGTVPEPYEKIEGCAFASRCEYTMIVCTKVKPPELSIESEHNSHCWLLDERSKRVTSPREMPFLKRNHNHEQ